MTVRGSRRGGISTVGVGAPASSGGLAVVGGTANALGTFVEVWSAAPIEAAGFFLSIVPSNGHSSQINFYALSMAFGAGGSEVVQLPDLTQCAVGITGTLGSMGYVYIPLRIPKGVRVSLALRCNQTINAPQINVAMTLCPAGPRVPPGFTDCRHYGFDQANTRGVQDNSGGSSNTLGPWSELSSSIDRAIRSWILMATLDAQTTVVTGSALFQVGVGAGGSERVLNGDGFQVRGVNGALITPGFSTMPDCDIPAGTRIATRHQTNSTNNSSLRVARTSLLTFN